MMNADSNATSIIPGKDAISVTTWSEKGWVRGRAGPGGPGRAGGRVIH